MNFMRNSCYCRSCNCQHSPTCRHLILDEPRKQNNNSKFVKIRNENGFLKTRSERLPVSEQNSRCTSKSSYNNKNDFLNIHALNLRTEEDPQNDKGLTEKRLWYENSHGEVNKSNMGARATGLYPYLTMPKITNELEYFLNSLTEKKLQDINNFRLENSENCFSIMSKYSINKRMGNFEPPIEEHICEFEYKLNSRDLPEPLNISEDGKLICRRCNEISNVNHEPNIIPTGTSQRQHKILIKIESDGVHMKASKEIKFKQIKRNQFLTPSNSRALIYQNLN